MTRAATLSFAWLAGCTEFTAVDSGACLAEPTDEVVGFEAEAVLAAANVTIDDVTRAMDGLDDSDPDGWVWPVHQVHTFTAVGDPVAVRFTPDGPGCPEGLGWEIPVRYAGEWTVGGHALSAVVDAPGFVLRATAAAPEAMSFAWDDGATSGAEAPALPPALVETVLGGWDKAGTCADAPVATLGTGPSPGGTWAQQSARGSVAGECDGLAEMLLAWGTW